jgi:lipoprotein-releasing system permease protein
MGSITHQQGYGNIDSSPQFKTKVIEFTIADVVNSGIYDVDKNFIYLPIEELSKRLYPNYPGPVASQVQIKLKDNGNAEASLSQIRNVWEKFAVEQLGWSTYQAKETEIATAKQLQAENVVELKKQMGALLVIFGIISFSVVMLVFCIFYMIVESRRKDIAIIKSCGATNTTVAFIFIGFGACVGFLGSIVGTVVGYYFIKNINFIEELIRIVFGLKLWKSSVYSFSTIPNNVDWDAVWYIAIFAIAAAAIGAIIPAITAFKTKPVNILRYE